MTATGVDAAASTPVAVPLNSLTTTTLCVQATLPTTAASSLQGATTNVTFTVHGTSY